MKKSLIRKTIRKHVPTSNEYFFGEIEYRDEQVKMMDEVFDYFSQKTKNRPFVLEAPTGSGKTIGYLYPLSYLATSTNPVVISTRSILLEEQLMLYAVPRSKPASSGCITSHISEKSSSLS